MLQVEFQEGDYPAFRCDERHRRPEAQVECRRQAGPSAAALRRHRSRQPWPACPIISPCWSTTVRASHRVARRSRDVLPRLRPRHSQYACHRAVARLRHCAQRSGRRRDQGRSSLCDERRIACATALSKPYDVLALPLDNRWGLASVAVYARERGSADLVDTIFRSTDDGMLALAALRDLANNPVDFQVVDLNAGASRLLQQARRSALAQARPGQPLACRRPRRSASSSMCWRPARRRQFELEVARGQERAFLRINVAAIGDLLSVTLTDVSDLKRRERVVPAALQRQSDADVRASTPPTAASSAPMARRPGTMWLFARQVCRARRSPICGPRRGSEPAVGADPCRRAIPTRNGAGAMPRQWQRDRGAAVRPQSLPSIGAMPAWSRSSTSPSAARPRRASPISPITTR